MNGRSFGLGSNFKPGKQFAALLCPKITHSAPFTAYLVITSAASALQNNWVIVLLHQWESCESVRIMSLTFAWKQQSWYAGHFNNSWECNSVAIVWSSHPTPLISCHSPTSVNGSPWCLSPSRGFLAIQKTKQDQLFRHFLVCTYAQRAGRWEMPAFPACGSVYSSEVDAVLQCHLFTDCWLSQGQFWPENKWWLTLSVGEDYLDNLWLRVLWWCLLCVPLWPVLCLQLSVCLNAGLCERHSSLFALINRY